MQVCWENGPYFVLSEKKEEKRAYISQTAHTDFRLLGSAEEVRKMTIVVCAAAGTGGLGHELLSFKNGFEISTWITLSFFWLLVIFLVSRYNRHDIRLKLNILIYINLQ